MASNTPRTCVVKEWIAAGCRLDTAALLELVSETHFVLEVHPRSLGYPDTTHATLPAAMNMARKLFKDGVNNKEIVRIFEAQDSETVVAQLRSVDTYTADGRPYSNEYLYVIDLVQEDERWKLGRVIEFMDSALLSTVHRS